MASSTLRLGLRSLSAAAWGTSVVLEVSSTIKGLKAASRKAKLYRTCVQWSVLSLEGVQLQLPGRHCNIGVEAGAAGRGMAAGHAQGRADLLSPKPNVSPHQPEHSNTPHLALTIAQSAA